VLPLSGQPTPTWPAAPVDERIVEDWLRPLSLRQRIAQLLVIPFYGESPYLGSDDEKNFQHLVREVGIGGLIILNRSYDGSVVRAEPYQMASFLNRMQRSASIPLIVAGDFERGASMRMNGTTVFPHAMAFGAVDDLEVTRQFGEATACEAKALGVHWILAPSADLNNNPENPVIHLRSFGEDPTRVSAHLNAFIRGVQQNPRCPLPATVKHFPGHGDTNVDSHTSLPVIRQSMSELTSQALVPFREAIEGGVFSVMPGHLQLPALESKAIPAIVSDGMDMKAISGRYQAGDAAVRALEAGIDVLVIPPDPVAAVDGIEAAVKSGRISEERVNESVRRVLRMKAALELDKNKLVDIEQIAAEIPSPERKALAIDVARKAMTLIRNQRNTLPLRAGNNTCAVVLNRSRFTTDGRTFGRAFLAKDARAKVFYADETMSNEALAQLERDLKACTSVAVASFLPVASASTKQIPLPARQARLLKALEASSAKMILLPFANPYLISHFPAASAAVVPFSSVTTSETAAVEAIFGEHPFVGKSPIRIPGVPETMDSAAGQ
jgi:beta-N-acetylhexosaminidase